MAPDSHLHHELQTQSALHGLYQQRLSHMSIITALLISCLKSSEPCVYIWQTHFDGHYFELWVCLSRTPLICLGTPSVKCNLFHLLILCPNKLRFSLLDTQCPYLLLCVLFVMSPLHVVLFGIWNCICCYITSLPWNIPYLNDLHCLHCFVVDALLYFVNYLFLYTFVKRFVLQYIKQLVLRFK